MVDVTVASEVLDVDEDGNVAHGEQTNEDGEVLNSGIGFCSVWGSLESMMAKALREHLQSHGMLK